MCSFLEKVFPIVWARGLTDTRISYTSGQPGVSITARSSAKRQSPEHVTLRRQFFFYNLLSLLHWRCAKNCYRSSRTEGLSPSLFFCCGESPRRRRVCDSVCARHGKRLPLRRQFELHVQCPLILSSEMLNVAWAGALRSKCSVMYAM